MPWTPIAGVRHSKRPPRRFSALLTFSWRLPPAPSIICIQAKPSLASSTAPRLLLQAPPPPSLRSPTHYGVSYPKPQRHRPYSFFLLFAVNFFLCCRPAWNGRQSPSGQESDQETGYVVLHSFAVAVAVVAPRLRASYGVPSPHLPESCLKQY